MAGIDFTTRSVPFKQDDFSGGLNSTSGPLNVKVNEAIDLQNIDFNKFGSFLKRSGYDRLNTSAVNSGATCTGLHWFEETDGTNTLIGVFGDKLYKMDSLDGTWDDITGGLTITAGDNNHWDFITFNDTVGMTNGVDAPITVDNTLTAAAMTLPSTVTIPKYIAAFNNYTFIANLTLDGVAKKSRLYWTNIDTIDTYTDTDFNEINLDDGQEITGIKALGDKLVIFKERSIWVAFFTGDSDIPFHFVPTPSSVGSISGHSAQEVLNGLVFLAQDGFYFFDGANSSKISDRITSTLDLFNKNRFVNVRSAFQREKNRYWCSFTTSGQTEHDRVITFDTANNAWSIYKGHAANVFVILVTSGVERIYFGDYAGFAYRADNGDNDSDTAGNDVAIDAFFKTKWFNFGDLVDEKGIAHAVLYHQIASNTVSFGYSYDFEAADQFTVTVDLSTSGDTYDTAGIVYGTATYSGSGGLSQRIDMTGRGYAVRYHVANSGIDEEFQIDGIGLLPHLETSV